MNDKSQYYAYLNRFYDGTVEGFWLFCKAYLYPLFDNFSSGSKIIDPQYDMISQLLDANTQFLAERKLATMWYRGAGKTTTADAFGIYLIVGKFYNDQIEEEYKLKGLIFDRNHPKIFLREARFMVIYSFTSDAAVRRTQTIQECFTNRRRFPEFHNDFGFLLQNKPQTPNKNVYEMEDYEVKTKRSEHVLIFNHGVRVESLGMGQAIQGGQIGGVRPDFVRFDDPENPRSRDNQVDLFRRNIDFITNDCYNAIDKKRGRIHVIGTNIATGCTIDTLTQPDSGWRHNVFPHVTTPVPKTKEELFSDNQVPTDPQRFPLKLIRLEYQMSEKLQDGLKGFYRDMYNIAYDPHSIDITKIKTFNEEFTLHSNGRDNILTHNTLWTKPKRAFISIGVDAGGAKAGNNKTSIVVCALTEDKELIILDSMLVNKPSITIDNNGFFDDIYRLAVTYNANQIVFEACGGGFKILYDNLVTYFQKLDNATHNRISYKLISFDDNQRTKQERVFPTLKSFIETEKLYIKAADAPILIKQIQNLSAGNGEDDFIDSIAISQHLCTAPHPFQYAFQPTTQSYSYTKPLNTQSILHRIYNRN